MDRDVIKARQAQAVAESLAKWSPELDGRVAVITGGARGLGAGLVEGFLQAGVKVAALDRTWNGSDELRDRLQTNGGLALDCDVTNDEEMDAAYAAVQDQLGTTDILINNAALVTETLWPPFGHKVTLDTTDADWQVMFDVNVFGVFKMTRRFIQPMLDKGRGSIINVVSSGAVIVAGGGGWFGLRPGLPEQPYQSTKAAVMQLTYYLANEVAGRGVAVNCFMPGHTRASWFDDTARAYAGAGRPYGLRPVIPEHALPLVLFLSAQDGTGATGMLYSAPDWNYDHGFGSYQVWSDQDLPPDMDDAATKLEERFGARSAPSMGLNTPANRMW